jgi:cell wall-associated NlpC family hydrolase
VELSLSCPTWSWIILSQRPVQGCDLLVTAPSGGWVAVDGFDAEQVSNAAIIVSVGMQLSVPNVGWVIAVATAMQESNLRNLPGGDRDSIGLFQQRPTQGWGSPAQIHDPVYAATKFYQKLLTVPGWRTMPLTEAAQAVQRSATPNTYAKHEPAATTLVNAIAAGLRPGFAADTSACLDLCPPVGSPATSRSGIAGCGNGLGVLARAATWLTAWGGGPVPYLSSSEPADWLHGYRRDCSGYVSMALGLPGPGLSTADLAARATAIQKADLRAGDLLINPAPDLAGHVAIFDHWTDTTMTSYEGFEQSGDSGTHHRVIPYPYFGDYVMSPYRWSY